MKQIVNNILVHICVTIGTITLLYTTGLSNNDNLKGKVIHQQTRKGIEGISVIVNDKYHATSNTDGELEFESGSANHEPEKIRILKEGLELASWRYALNMLSVEVRNATMKHIIGEVYDDEGNPLANEEIIYIDKNSLSVHSDDNGKFTFTIPHESEIITVEKFYIASHQLHLASVQHDVSASEIRIRLVAEAISSFQNPLELRLVDKGGNSLNNVSIVYGSQFFNSDEEGLIYLPSNIDWDKISISRYQIVAVDKTSDISVTLVLNKITSTDTLQAITNTIFADTAIEAKSYGDSVNISKDARENIISRGLKKVKKFYQKQEGLFQKQNEYISELSDSVSHLTDISELDHEHLLMQLEEMNRTMIQTSAAFEETRSASKVLIERIREILDHKDQTIKNIQQEKVQLYELHKYNIKMLSLILLAAVILLMMAYWVIRRFKKQNSVIRRTQEQLLEAQEMAQVVNMVYDFDQKSISYSDNFFKTLQVNDLNRKKRLLGHSNEFIPSELIDKGDLANVLSCWKTMLVTRRAIHNVEFKAKSDTESSIYVEMNSKLYCSKEGRRESITCTIQNISEKKENELKLVRTLTELEKASAAKEEFMASMSHEIRTPLNAIIGLTEHLLSQKHLGSQLENLNAIRFSSQHLLSLVNDMLDYSRIRAGKLKIESSPFDLIEVIHGLKKSMLNSASEKNLYIDEVIDPLVPRKIKGDSLRISQVLINLVGNAIKFTESGGLTIGLQLEDKITSPARVRFSVKDTGVGISAENQHKIFEDFVQEDVSTARNYGGSGLGLTISKELVNLMDGELKLESEVNVGSEFYFVLPLEVSEELKVENTNHAPVPDDQLRDVRVLCVEDNMINQLVISQYFKKWNIKHQFANNGTEALEKFDPEQFDLVFMDIRMPDIDGYEVSRRIFDKYPNERINIVALTAEVSEQSEKKFEEVGMLGCLPKPFKEEEFIETIKRVLN